MHRYLFAIAFFSVLAYSSAFADKGKVVQVPQHIYDSMTEEQRAQAIEYARQNGIRWRVVKPKGVSQ